MENYVKKILDLFFANNYPKDVQHEVQNWLLKDRNQQEKEYLLLEKWDNLSEQSCSQEEKNSAYHRLKLQISKEEHTSPKMFFLRNINFWRVAAILCLIFCSSIIVWTYNDKHSKTDLLQCYIPVGELNKVSLPDGTVVQLNSHTTLLYPSEFSGDTRTVFLMGEAIFKVAHNAKKPFIVKTNDFEVTALGTRFNVHAYPEDKAITTTLIEGSIKVDFPKSHLSKVLVPLQQISYDRKTGKEHISNPSIDDVTAWTTGDLVMGDMNLEEIFSRLERRYPVHFVYTISKLPSSAYSFRFPAKATLNEVLMVISKVVTNLHYELKGDKCFIRI